MVDLARANPVLNPVVDVATEGPRALGGFVSPVANIVSDQIYNRSLFTGRDFRVKGSASYAKNEALTGGVRARIALDDALSIAYPYRLAKKTGIPGIEPPQIGTQGDDALLFSPRPLRYKTREAQEKERHRRALKSSPGRQALEDSFPLGFPKPDDTRRIVRERQEERSPKRSATGGQAPGWGPHLLDEPRRPQRPARGTVAAPSSDWGPHLLR
jgi:hypothetical protein